MIHEKNKGLSEDVTQELVMFIVNTYLLLNPMNIYINCYSLCIALFKDDAHVTFFC